MTDKEYEREASRERKMSNDRQSMKGKGSKMKERQAEKGIGAMIDKEYERGSRREGERMKERQGKERGKKNDREVGKEGKRMIER